MQGTKEIKILVLVLPELEFSHFKVPWHEIILSQNMPPINAFIKIAFLFFEVWSENLAFIQNIGPWNWGIDFLIALITFGFCVALNTIAWVYWLL